MNNKNIDFLHMIDSYNDYTNQNIENNNEDNSNNIYNSNNDYNNFNNNNNNYNNYNNELEQEQLYSNNNPYINKNMSSSNYSNNTYNSNKNSQKMIRNFPDLNDNTQSDAKNNYDDQYENNVNLNPYDVNNENTNDLTNNKNTNIINSSQFSKNSSYNNLSNINNNNTNINQANIVNSTVDDTNLNNEDNYIIVYVQNKRLAYENMKSKNYLSAHQNFATCYQIVSYYKDYIKMVDCLINISICDFYNGNFQSSFEKLTSAVNIYNQIAQDMGVLEGIHLGIKIYTNLCTTNLALGKSIDAINNIKIIISLINQEVINKKKISLIRTVIYYLFKINSLVDNSLTDNMLNSVLPNQLNDLNNNKTILSSLIKSFHYFLQDKGQNFEYLKNVFKDSAIKYKNLKEMTNYYFATFYHYSIIYNYEKKLTPNQKKQLKEKIEKCNEYLIKETVNVINNNESTSFNASEIRTKDVEIFMEEFKKKAEASIEIYNLIYEYEIELINTEFQNNNNMTKSNLNVSTYSNISHIFTNEQISKEPIIKILINNSYKYLYYLNEQNPNKSNYTLFTEMKIIKDKMDKGELDISKVKINCFNKEIINELKQIFDNLIIILTKAKMRLFFQNTKNIGDLNYQNLINKLQNKADDQNQLYFNQLNKVVSLIKINFYSKGCKEHFYNIDINKFRFNVKKSKQENSENKESFSLLNEVMKITYGICGDQLLKKVCKEKDKLDGDEKKVFDAPWRIFSFVLKDRSIDLFLPENNVNTYFYGLRYLFLNKANYKVKYKMISSTKFILIKMKYKIHKLICEMYGKNKIKKDDENIISGLIKKKDSVNALSFTSLFMLYYKFCMSEE